MNSKVSKVILLKHILKDLKLSGVLTSYEECIRQAYESGIGYEEFLLELLTRESERRYANRQKRRITEAKFPYLKPLEKTDLSKWPGIEPLQIKQISECTFIEKQENIVILGKHGTGKTHAAISFGIEACRKGLRVFFTTAADLVNTLIEMRNEKELKQYLTKLDRYKLLIIDELGYIPLSQEGSQLLFQVFTRRYEKGSVLITTNLPFQDWTSVLGDANLTAALLDRLTHHCHIFQFDWESIRFKESLKNRDKIKMEEK